LNEENKREREDQNEILAEALDVLRGSDGPAARAGLRARDWHRKHPTIT
jgi:hypothetical protein